MVRLRIPGGRTNASTVAAVSSLAKDLGDPDITLTSRGSLQLRGLPQPLPRELITAIGDLDLVPSGAHDKARNIVADPAPGLDDLVAELDAGLLADPGLAGLPGRFLLAVAEPDGPVLAQPWDIAIVDERRPEARGTGPHDPRGRLEGRGTARVLVDGHSVVVDRADAPRAALDVARRFLAVRPDERTWNVRDLPASEDADGATAAQGASRADLLPGGTPFAVAPGEPPAPGPVGDDLVALVPLGLLTPAMALSLDEVGGVLRRPSSPGGPVSRLRPEGPSHLDHRVVVTPWRSIVLPGGAEYADDLAAAGLVTTPDSPWSVLTACAGAPSCSRTTTPTRRIAQEAAPFVDVDGPPVHVIGCDRACGHPAREHAIALNPSSAADVVAAQRS